MNVQNIIMLNKHGLTIYLSYYINSPGGLFTKERNKWSHALFFEVSKSFSNGLNLSFAANNLLDTKVSEFYNSQDYSYNRRRLIGYSSFVFKISYSFGKRRVRGADDADNAKLEERISK